MPEFVMEGRDNAARTESAFVLGFIEAMFFTECSPAYDSAEWFSDECKAAQEEGQADGSLPGDVGYDDIHPDSLRRIREFCGRKRGEMGALLVEAYDAHWKRAAMAEGWRERTSGEGFVNPSEDCDNIHAKDWQTLCIDEGIEPGEEYDETQAGRDLWFTYNGHGVGYWDRKQLENDGLGQRLSDTCGRGEISPFFGGHVAYGDAPFVHVDGLR